MALRLTEDEAAPVQAVAEDEHGGNLSSAARALLAEALVARTNADELNQLRLLVGALISDDGREHARLFALEAVAEAARGAIVEPPGTDWWYRTRDALAALDALPAQAVADAEHDGDLSAAIRALLAEALTARQESPRDLSGEPFARVVTAAVAWCEHGTRWARDELRQAVKAYRGTAEALTARARVASAPQPADQEK